MIPRSHPLAGVREAYNAVFIEAEAAGQLMFYGVAPGSADRERGARRHRRRRAQQGERRSGHRGSAYADLRVRPMGEAAPATT